MEFIGFTRSQKKSKKLTNHIQALMTKVGPKGVEAAEDFAIDKDPRIVELAYLLLKLGPEGFVAATDFVIKGADIVELAYLIRNETLLPPEGLNFGSVLPEDEAETVKQLLGKVFDKLGGDLPHSGKGCSQSPTLSQDERRTLTRLLLKARRAQGITFC